MDRIQTDIVVVGGGVAGLIATAAMAAAGYDVICVEPSPALTTANQKGTDLRSTAFWAPSIALLQEAGLWPRLETYAAPLSVMRIIDAGGEENLIREAVDFTAADLGRDVFGYNLPNRILQREISAHLGALPNVRMLTGVRVAKTTPRTTAMLLHLSDQTTVQCKLAIAADGRDSTLRDAAGMSTKRWRYGQKALVLAVSHPCAHENVSIEIHRTGGPFTLVPLPDHDGKHHSAIVWMETGPKADDLNRLSDADFEVALNERSCNVLGHLTPAGPRGMWPIISQLASRLDAPRLALIAEAAHVVPPIGAQGLNMSLSDIGALRDIITKSEDPGLSASLSRYHSTRWPDMSARVAGIDALNRAAMAQSPLLRDLRRSGLKMLSGAAPLRHKIMEMGLGASRQS